MLAASWMGTAKPERPHKVESGGEGIDSAPYLGRSAGRESGRNRQRPYERRRPVTRLERRAERARRQSPEETEGKLRRVGNRRHDNYGRMPESATADAVVP